VDKSEEYIKMSKQSPLRELWEPQLGDYCVHPEGEWLDTGGWVVTEYYDITRKVSVFRGMASHISGSYKYKNYEDFEKEDCIPLFRQDQLQEMYKENKETDLAILSDIAYVALSPKDHKDHYYICYNSMEQLWLAFVVKEKYGKVWNGEAWENNENK